MSSVKTGKFIKCNCGKVFYAELNRLKNGRGKYCSRLCCSNGKIGTHHRSIKKGKIINCLICKKEFYVRPSYKKRGIKFYSRKCYFSSKIGCKPGNWKGGKKKSVGYILIFSPNHPFTPKGRYIPEHRLVAEKYLGRYLEPEERVHHINGKSEDNRRKNLYLFPSNSKHIIFHHLKNKPILKSNLSSAKRDSRFYS